MIGRIQGILVERQPPQIVLMANGVGYEIDVPMSTFYGLPALQEEVMLYTQLIVREDAHLLYGFATQAERECFRSLIKVSGIGAKSALSILSSMSVTELATAVQAEDIVKIRKTPGVGVKTAERLVLELRGKLTQNVLETTKSSLSNSSHVDILQALIALGYNEKESTRIIENLPSEVGVSEGIRLALKSLSKV